MTIARVSSTKNQYVAYECTSGQSDVLQIDCGTSQWASVSQSVATVLRPQH